MCGTWPPSEKMDMQRNRIWTIPHIWKVHFLYIHKISEKYLDWGHKYAPKTKFKTGRLATDFYFQFQFWQVSSFGNLPVYDRTKRQENCSKRGWVIRNLTFSIPTLKPTLPTAQRHSAVMQAVSQRSFSPNKSTPQTGPRSVQPRLHSEATWSRVTERLTDDRNRPSQ